MRKPIAISTSLNINIYLKVVICDDGSMWDWCDEDRSWNRLPNIPQDKEEYNG